MLRIDTHHHMIPPDYRDMLHRAGIDEAGGRALPDWSPDGSLQTMAELDVGTAILSVSAPGMGGSRDRPAGVRLKRGVACAMPDGIRLISDHYYPAEPGPDGALLRSAAAALPSACAVLPPAWPVPPFLP